MTSMKQPRPLHTACQGLPLEQALAICGNMDWAPQVIYTGERQPDAQYTPRVIAVREDVLIVSLFRDGAPGQAREE